MPDYIYLLENRLSADQQNALHHLREAAREAGMILFLTGSAVRDLHSGHAVRGLEVAVHGNALNLQKKLESLGAQLWGQCTDSSALYLCFPGTVRVDVVSTHRVEYPTPGKPVFHPASIQEDLRRRDFTANAMALSLNEGSFGLLMDPTNGVADIEARTLRLVSNYGFLEEPSLMIRATRLMTRLGWEMDPKTQTRYENAKGEGVIEYLSEQSRSRELEQIGHEDEPLKVLEALESEGWMQVLFPAWTAAKADPEKIEALLTLALELLAQGVHADKSAAQMQLLTAKMNPKELAALKKSMLRPGFVEEWNNLDAMAAAFQKVLLSKENATPSLAYKLFTSYDPEAILWLGFTSKTTAVQERFHQFLKVWPETRQRIPYALMQEMRITPELTDYARIVLEVFLQLIDGKLTTVEEMKAFLEPYSPPAPPPQATIKRTRAKRGEAKVKHFEEDDENNEDEDSLDEEDLDDLGADEDDEIDLEVAVSKLPLKGRARDDSDEDEDSDDDDGDDEADQPAAKVKQPAKSASKPKPANNPKPASTPKAPIPAKKEKEPPPPAPAVVKPAAKVQAAPVKKAATPVLPAKAAKPAAKATEKPAAKAPAKAAAKPAAHKPAPAPAKVAPKPVVAAKSVKPAPKPTPKPAAKPTPKPAAKTAAKPVAKPVAKAVPAKAKPVASKHVAPAKKVVAVKKAAKPAPKKATKKR